MARTRHESFAWNFHDKILQVATLQHIVASCMHWHLQMQLKPPPDRVAVLSHLFGSTLDNLVSTKFGQNNKCSPDDVLVLLVFAPAVLPPPVHHRSIHICWTWCVWFVQQTHLQWIKINIHGWRILSTCLPLKGVLCGRSASGSTFHKATHQTGGRQPVGEGWTHTGPHSGISRL